MWLDGPLQNMSGMWLDGLLQNMSGMRLDGPLKICLEWDWMVLLKYVWNVIGLSFTKYV